MFSTMMLKRAIPDTYKRVRSKKNIKMLFIVDKTHISIRVLNACFELKGGMPNQK